MKAVFLYSELAGYSLACFKAFCEQGNELLIYRWPINSEAPFVFDSIANCEIKDRSGVSVEAIKEEIESFGADVIVTSGWLDKDYLEITKSFKGKIPTVLIIDNHWEGNLRQRFASLISPIYLKRIFSHAWVPGKLQKVFAEKLGFGGKISEGFYSADVDLFEKIGERSTEAKQKSYPKHLRVLQIRFPIGSCGVLVQEMPTSSV